MQIVEIMGKKLIVTDLYGSTNLVGWQQVSRSSPASKRIGGLAKMETKY